MMFDSKWKRKKRESNTDGNDVDGDLQMVKILRSYGNKVGGWDRLVLGFLRLLHELAIRSFDSFMAQSLTTTVRYGTTTASTLSRTIPY